MPRRRGQGCARCRPWWRCCCCSSSLRRAGGWWRSVNAREARGRAPHAARLRLVALQSRIVAGVVVRIYSRENWRVGEAWEGGRPALTPRSLQFAHPRRDLRCALRWRAARGLMPPSSSAAVTAVVTVPDTDPDPPSAKDAAGRGMVSPPK